MNFLKSQGCREFLAELLGTFTLMVINNGVIAVFIFNKPVTVDVLAMGYVAGIGAMIGIMLSTPVSGGHINPAVTVAFAASKKLPWSKVPYYLLGQYLGSFLAQVCVYFVYLDAFNHFDGGFRQAFGSAKSTGKVYATYPAPGVSLATCFIDEVFGTGILLLGVMAITDRRGMKLPSYLQPFFISLWIAAICTAFGYNTGAILNPARDVAPRIFTALVGYGWKPFEPLNGHYWYVAGLVGPHIGGIVGVFLYEFVIGSALDKEEEVLEVVDPIFPEPTRMKAKKVKGKQAVDRFTHEMVESDQFSLDMNRNGIHHADAGNFYVRRESSDKETFPRSRSRSIQYSQDFKSSAI